MNILIHHPLAILSPGTVLCLKLHNSAYLMISVTQKELWENKIVVVSKNTVLMKGEH